MNLKRISIVLLATVALLFSATAVSNTAYADELKVASTKKATVINLNNCFTNLDHWGDVSTYKYTGKAIKPKVKVYDKNGKAISSSLYKVKYSNNISPNMAGNDRSTSYSPTVKIVAVKGKSKGSTESFFNIKGQNVYVLDKINGIDYNCNYVYTNSESKYKKMIANGWYHIDTYVSAYSGTAVHELYNSKLKRYQYTYNSSVINKLKKAGYKDNGVAFYSDPNKAISIANYSDLNYTKWYKVVDNKKADFYKHYYRRVVNGEYVKGSNFKLSYLTGYVAGHTWGSTAVA